jgi:hypothetical protein
MSVLSFIDVVEIGFAPRVYSSRGQAKSRINCLSSDPLGRQTFSSLLFSLRGETIYLCMIETLQVSAIPAHSFRCAQRVLRFKSLFARQAPDDTLDISHSWRFA